MDYKTRILSQAKANNGIITSRWCVENQVPKIYLTRMTKTGKLKRIARGIYATEEADYDSYRLLQQTNPVCIFSYVSALDILEMTDIIPQHIEVTVYTGYNPSHLPKDVIVHYIREDLHHLGVIEHTTKFGNPVKTYNLERTICDLISNRDKVDSELFSKTIIVYARKKDRNMALLFAYAEKMNITRKVQQLFEVLQIE